MFDAGLNIFAFLHAVSCVLFHGVGISAFRVNTCFLEEEDIVLVFALVICCRREMLKRITRLRTLMQLKPKKYVMQLKPEKYAPKNRFYATFFIAKLYRFL